ncbi:MAG: bifunctional hydroxymethylpyrimidine kinase/phosphomethylpyrimidine kinase [Alphaproteobacteria bacterium]|nr:bifunctional hydroxymethylpyrimidine kinase/phosphomethylpyrimidine kinase [Alphaproteobacteria bacterium]
MTRGRVLIVAGSDSGGGAGIQADIKTVTALGGYAATAIAALTAQNTMGVFGILDVPPEFVAQQMALVLDDIGADAIKTGMLHCAEVIGVVCDEIAARAPDVPVVVDPVMVAKGGQALLQDAAQQALRDRLLPLAAVLTPNVPEAEALTGRAIVSDADMEAAARALLAMGPKAVLLKGGHREGPVVRDLLVTREGIETFEAPRIETKHTHGTGCTLASAVATGLAQGRPLKDAVARAHAYVQAAIRAAPGLGKGKGPLGHGHTVRPFETPS